MLRLAADADAVKHHVVALAGRGVVRPDPDHFDANGLMSAPLPERNR